MNASQVSSPDHPGIIDQLSNHESRLRVIAARGKMSHIRLTDRVKQKVTRDRDATPEDKDLRIKHRTEARAGLAQPATQLTQCVQRSRIVVSEESCQSVAGQSS